MSNDHVNFPETLELVSSFTDFKLSLSLYH